MERYLEATVTVEIEFHITIPFQNDEDAQEAIKEEAIRVAPGYITSDTISIEGIEEFEI